MLHLRCRIALRVDITNLLQFQCPLHRYGVVVASPEVDEVLRVCKGLCEVGYLLILLQHFRYLFGNLRQLMHHAQVLHFVHRAFGATDTEREHGERGNLCGERFGGRHAYLRSHVGIATAVRHTRYRCTYHIAYREDKRPFGFCQLDSRQCVGGLTRLRDGYHHIVLVYHRLAVAELARVLHLHRYLRKLLHRVHRYQPCMPRGAARGDDDTLRVEETLFVVNKARESNVVLVNVHAPAHRVRQRPWLLVDLFEHEMRVAAFLQLRQRQL